VADWSFLTNHARAMLFIAGHPDARLRDLAAALDVTERTAYGIVADLTEAGYVVKERDGRRNRYQIQKHLPLPDRIGMRRTIGEVLDLLGEGKGGEALDLVVEGKGGEARELLAVVETKGGEAREHLAEGKTRPRSRPRRR